jgi:hypothetical protein
MIIIVENVLTVFRLTRRLEVINVIRDPTKSGYHSVLMEIDQRRNELEMAQFSHEHRVSNTHAHNLARFYLYL